MTVDIDRFVDCRVLVVGDLMIDEYLWGDVDRISPEAPVQVVSVTSEDFTLGGAGNVVNNLVALGANVSVAGVAGVGEDGRQLMKIFDQLGVDTTGVVQDASRPTTRKTRILAAHQHVLRIDRETRREISRTTFDRLVAFLASRIAEVDVVLVSDYAKGVVTPELMAELLNAANAHQVKVVVDPKGSDFSKYDGVDLITPNLKEAQLASGVEIGDEADLIRTGQALIARTRCRHLLITCGKDGMLLFGDGQKVHRIRAEARQVFDVSGAGDTVLAVIGLGLASGADCLDSSRLANTAAGIVVGKVGTATVSRRELAAALRPFRENVVQKLRNAAELVDEVARRRRMDQKIVLTNGCFDLLHVGHIQLLSASKQLGDCLIVAIDDDASVRRIKGDGRPVIGSRERVRILDAMDVVDYVTVFAEGELEPLIETVKPDVLTKGSNYASGEVIGNELVDNHGGRVVLIPVTEKVSSSHIINSIKSGRHQHQG
jgi:D-beta-D-heptose 7-phosphate kinase/D-beta-D-heptose 1-phosphate adenosyltransferase